MEQEKRQGIVPREHRDGVAERPAVASSALVPDLDAMRSVAGPMEDGVVRRLGVLALGVVGFVLVCFTLNILVSAGMLLFEGLGMFPAD